MRLAIEDLAKSFPKQYRKADPYLRRLAQFEAEQAEMLPRLAKREEVALKWQEQVLALQREALLGNPLLDFDRLLLVRRGGGPVPPDADDTSKAARKAAKLAAKSGDEKPKPVRKRSETAGLGLPQNWQGDCSLRKNGYDNEIAMLSPVRPNGKLSVLYRPDDGRFVGDVRLHFDARRMMFSMPSEAGSWQIFEVGVDGGGLRQVTPGDHADIDNYDSCYLPDGRVLFTTTANMQGVPCVGGSAHVANLALLDPKTGKVRLLTCEQDHDWGPTLLPNGRVLYARWEYTDSAHYFTRLLFHMNPDGTGQMEYYGSNSYWPNSLFYARPIPGSATKFVGIVSGHHGVPRMGELVLFDTAKGRHENDGVVQRIPGRGQEVKPVIVDALANNSWPRFLHPCPLSDKYFLVTCKPTPDAHWGIYLADVFDNLVLVREEPGSVLFEPVPLRTTPRPPVIPDRIDPAQKEATVYLVDVYRGPGLEGIPRGTVKQLRVLAYNYCYQGVGGHDRIGVESSWDVKRVLGTVPVEEDGSALFRVPANTPIAVQPLDEQGRSLQLMRSWFTAQPGEVLSCVGCHDAQNSSTPSQKTLAAGHGPGAIDPWYGPARGFSFRREVQPVLDKYCVGCHDGKSPPAGKAILNLASQDLTEQAAGVKKGRAKSYRFPQSYLALHPYVSRPGPESDYHILTPMEYHASSSELVQMLEKGHHGVRLNQEAWSRLYTWIDLNAPCYGSWAEAYEGNAHAQDVIKEKFERRKEYQKLYANVDVDPAMEDLAAVKDVAQLGGKRVSISPLPRAGEGPGVRGLKIANWPFDAAAAKRLQSAAGPTIERTLDLGGDVKLRLALIPAGKFVMGDLHGQANEQPACVVKVERPFWMGVTEVTNAQFARFDARHDSGYIDQQGKDHNVPGFPANLPGQPAIRVSWEQAMAFCEWLGRQSGSRVSLPTESQWEWACRAGTATPLWYGAVDADFAPVANLGDTMLANFASRSLSAKPLASASPLMSYLPRIDAVNDGQMIAAPAGSYQANPWGLRDMHGNVAEWTRSTYRPYPYDTGDGRDDPAAPGAKVVRGGSWHDRPERARSAFRLAFPAYQRLFTVGFRVTVEGE